MDDFIIQGRPCVIAVFGPSASGKSTFISRLFSRYPERFIRTRIVTTRPVRDGESLAERLCLSREEFLRRQERGELCFVSSHYGHFHGAEKSQIREMAQSGKALVFDPNQFERLAMIEAMFPSVEIGAIYFVPRRLEELAKLSDDEIRGIFTQRMDGRGDLANAELQARIDETVFTMRECSRRRVSPIIINDFETPIDALYEEFESLVNRIIERSNLSI